MVEEDLASNGVGDIGSWVNLHVDVLSVKRYFFSIHAWAVMIKDYFCYMKNKVCGQPICVNDNGHAKSFKNVCAAMKYLRGKRRLAMISVGLGDCRALFSSK